MRLRALAGALLLAASLSACAGAFLPRREPIDLGPDRTRRVSISVEGPEDMPEWGELLWSELVQTLSASSAIEVVEPAPGVWLVKATVDTWDYAERMEPLTPSRFATDTRRAGPDYYRQCTAVMGVTIEVRDPEAAEAAAERKYLGVEHGTQDQPQDRFRAPQTFIRRAAGKVAAQFADDLEAGK